MSLARWANFKVLSVSCAELQGRILNYTEKCHEPNKRELIMNVEQRQFDFKTDHVDGLTFAIIVVFEFPPKESCIQRCRYNHFTFTNQS